VALALRTRAGEGFHTQSIFEPGEPQCVNACGFFAYLGDAGSDAKEMQVLEEMATKLLETARKLPPGSERHDFLKEIGTLRVRITALKAKG
jgi:hypothetical protein